MPSSNDIEKPSKTASSEENGRAASEKVIDPIRDPGEGTRRRYEPIPFAEIADACILIVEDMLILRQLIQKHLAMEGFTNIHLAVDGRDALEKIDKIRPQLIILDIVMPEADGFDVCREIRRRPKYDHVPIIIQTGLEKTGERLRIFNEGANDMLIKPINGAELVARTKIHLQNSLLQAKLLSYQERMSKELNAALQVQSSLMPDQDDIAILQDQTGLTIGAYYLPSSELGGDLWGAALLDEGMLAVYCVDFSGHGVASALQTFRLHTFLSDSDWDWAKPVVWLEEVNQRLCKLLSVGQFATVFYAVIDRENGKLQYASAGAPPVIYRNGQSGACQLLETAGLPVGISKQASYILQEIDFMQGSQLHMYSDAYIETGSSDKAALTEEDLLKLADNLADISDGQSRIDALLGAFPGKDLDRLPDDLTLVSIANPD